MHLSNNLLKLHFTVFIWGFTAILGALIHLDSGPLVWYRMGIAALCLSTWQFLRNKMSWPGWKNISKYVFIGFLVALHWVFFFASIKVGTVSVALVCLSTQTLMTGIIEPFFVKTKLSKFDLFIGLLIVIGIAIIFKFETQYTLCIQLGLLAALTASIFSSMNAVEVRKADPISISAYELWGGWMGIGVYGLFQGWLLDTQQMTLLDYDWLWIILLSVVCTALAYVLGMAVMQELSAFTVALVTNLEPVYGILLALLIFNKKEHMSFAFYIGALLILMSVILYPYLKGRIEDYKARRLID